MSVTPAVLVSRVGTITTLTLNRPNVRNALNRQMRLELTDALVAAADDDTTRVIVLRGDERAFCAGGDLKEAAHVDSTVLLAMGKRLILSLLDVPKITVAVIRGHCAGAGISVALACDLVVADDTALFTPAFLAAGLAPDMGATHWLARQLGVARAKEILLTGRALDGAEAAQLGLVSRWWSASALEAELDALVNALADLPPGAAQATRRLVNGAFERGLPASYDAETEAALLVITRAQIDRQSLRA